MLHPYQNEAVDLFLRRQRLLVAYEMGLGKTIVATAAAEELLGLEEIDMVAVVVPAALKYQWAQSIARSTDVPTRLLTLKGEDLVVPTEDYAVIVDGTAKQREVLLRVAALKRVDYVILGYENVVNDWKWVSKLKPGMIVLDEATAIKSFQAQRSKKIKRWKAPYRMAMTGTPVENRPEEIFSIMQWVDDSVLGRFDLFDKTYITRNHFGGVSSYKHLDVLHRKIRPAVSRKKRLDPDVRPYLPEVDEGVWMVKADTKTATVYRRIVSDLKVALAEAGPSVGAFDVAAYYHGQKQVNENTALGRVMSRQLALEMLLDHPDLLVRSGKRYLDPKSNDGSQYAAELVESGALDHLNGSAKLDFLVDEVVDILETDPRNRVVVFTVFRGMLDLLEKALPYSCVQFHGGLNSSAKAAAISKFEADPQTRVFLSSHAGGYGVDLFMANYLINYDLAWSSGKQDQINARHVRASSKFDNVYIRNVLVQGSVEERKYATLAHKRAVAGSIIDGVGGSKIENEVASLSRFIEQSSL